jgi:hypothetical protein
VLTLGVVKPVDDIVQQLLRLFSAAGPSPLVLHPQLQRRPPHEDEGSAFLENGAVLGRQLHAAAATANKDVVAQDNPLSRHRVQSA